MSLDVAIDQQVRLPAIRQHERQQDLQQELQQELQQALSLQL